jgi:exodeoxyribonuclease VII small subunit
MTAKKQLADDMDSAKENEFSFEDALRDLERIVGQLENGSLGLEQSLKEYEVGVKRLRQCHQKLEMFERRVELLTGFTADGTPVTEPFGDAVDASLEEKQANRSTRRSSKKTDLEQRDGGLF